MSGQRPQMPRAKAEDYASLKALLRRPLCDFYRSKTGGFMPPLRRNRGPSSHGRILARKTVSIWLRCRSETHRLIQRLRRDHSRQPADPQSRCSPENSARSGLPQPGPRRHRAPLYDRIRLLARNPRPRQHQQHLAADAPRHPANRDSPASAPDTPSADRPSLPSRISAKSSVTVASGPMNRSTLEWLISRSCHSVTFSSAGTTAARTTRASPVRFSDSTGFRLCGIALLPFCPAWKNSSASRTSLRCRCRISVASRSIPLATTASVQKKRSVPIPRDHLRRHRLGLQPELLRHILLDRRVEMGIRPDRSADRADRNLRPAPARAALCSEQIQRSARRA